MQKAVHSGLPFVVQKNKNMEVYYGRRKNRKTKSKGNHRQAGGRIKGTFWERKVQDLADADNFESHPMDAAVMVVSYIHAKGLQSSETQYDEFLCKYDSIFTYPDENDAEHEVENYIEELTAIIEDYL